MENSDLNQNQTPPGAPPPAERSPLDETRPVRLDAGTERQSAETDAQTQAVPLNLDVTQATPVVDPPPEGEASDLSATLAGAALSRGYEDTGVYEVEPASETPQTAPPASPPPSPPVKARHAPRKGLPWFFYPLVGVTLLVVVLLISGFGGYSSGISLRKRAEKTQVAQVAAEQFELGIQDMEQGAFERARQRFEYVIQLDPNYPSVTEKLAEVLLQLNTTATPTLLPTPTLEPTPDTRDSQQRFDQAQQALAANDWTTTIDSLLVLRKLDPSYRAVEIDGLLFLALRNRGRDKILKSADLEGGIYDLTLANQFGPLDAEAQGLLSWSSLYITGASFWGIDWEQAVNYFSQVAPNLPNLMDSSKMTATERLRQALFEYGNVLARRGQYCAAVRAYQQSYDISPDPAVQQAGELAAKGCSGAEEQPAGTPKPKKPKATQGP